MLMASSNTTAGDMNNHAIARSDNPRNRRRIASGVACATRCAIRVDSVDAFMVEGSRKPADRAHSWPGWPRMRLPASETLLQFALVLEHFFPVGDQLVEDRKSVV